MAWGASKVNATCRPLFTACPYLINSLQKFWPHLTAEIILMDYLFGTDLVKRKDRAILMMVCLIDLQEDFRYHVKRAFLNYLLG